ncbi:PadR family transcriptional regulator [Sphingobium boeckii]|uniref:DNA-binding PadR family transcriptional regulator n=1 Tax=Sphingobium boeckii TaxID=1082345 RepID=A0A7W9AHB1_9SPHN|nr:PadR family transcriptional regulator [Sphingobium boeckii]MBB5685634.1 DNA-binding PadR family transcriptional regulator [Sphingobium boeckii]
MFHRHKMRGFGPRGGGRFGREGIEGGWGRGHGGGGRTRGRRVFDAGELKLVLLKLIADQPRHGYDLIRAIEERTGGAYAPSPGVIYPTLTLLEDMSLIEEAKSEGAKRLFAITAAGTGHLADHAEDVDALFARLAALGEDAARTDSKSIRRALGNFRQALHDRLSEEDATDEVKSQIVVIIDEAAQKIERLK